MTNVFSGRQCGAAFKKYRWLLGSISLEVTCMLPHFSPTFFWINVSLFNLLYFLKKKKSVSVSVCVSPFWTSKPLECRSQCPHNSNRGSAAALLLKLWVRFPPVTWMSVCLECCVLSGRGLCDELIIRVDDSYRLCCVVVCDLETSWKRRPCSTGGYCNKKKLIFTTHYNGCYAIGG
jgi:hypothetical protein